tara:strand:- start:313 stop:597 length:285 start_codon:yes stop_codon:yes gene_type:complete
MKNDIVKAFYHNDWCVMPFPRVNSTVLYNTKTKKVEFYKGIPQKQEIKSLSSSKNNKRGPEINVWRIHCMWLAVCLGVTTALLFTIALAKYFSA